ncbi:MAG: rRNA maturation RNase YbeY [Chloroflexota bacterium]|nr:rRNA maturation RNase YbeY [Chloroflexota bacterium]
MSQNWLSAVADEAMNVALGETESGHLSIALVDDSTVQELNARFRGLDEITDVLSFSTSHSGHWQSDSSPAPDTLLMDPSNIDPFSFLECHNKLPNLGEIVISLPQAERQAIEKKYGLDQELSLLIVHGALHLVGYDHSEPNETALMKYKEQVALNNLFPNRLDVE